MAGVHLEVEQVADSARVLRTVQPLKWTTTRVRFCTGCRVHGRFERSDESGVCHGIRVRRRGRRHQARLQLSNHLLRDFGVPAGVCDVKIRERQPGGLRLVVVAGDAVATDDCVVILRRCGKGCVRAHGHGPWQWFLRRGGADACRKAQPRDRRAHERPSRRVDQSTPPWNAKAAKAAKKSCLALRPLRPLRSFVTFSPSAVHAMAHAQILHPTRSAR